MKQLLLLLALFTSFYAKGGTLNETLGLTNFLFDSNNFDKVSQFKLQRYFVDNFRITKTNLDFWTQPTWQNFKHDDILANAKKNGVTNIWCTQGAFDWQGVQGKQGKVNPVSDTDDPLLQSSWSDYGRIVKQIAIRYADDTAPYLSQARVFQSATYQNNIPKAGLGLVDAMEDRNEWDFKHSWSGAKYTMTPEQSAVGFKVFIDSVRSVSKTMKLIMGGTINPEVETFTRFIKKLQELYAAEGKEMPTDWYLCFHWYMRDGSINQGAGTWGITPEAAKAYRFGLQMDSLCRVYGLLGWYCTETGWSTYEGTNTDLRKQNAPVLQGYDIYHSQGICMVRLALIWGATEYCKGVTFWHRKDNDDVGAYQHGGVNYANWTPKYGQTIIGEYLSKYRDFECSNFRNSADSKLFAVDISNNDTLLTLVWTDQNRFGEYDAKPREGILPMPASIFGRHLYVPTATTGIYRLKFSDTHEDFIARWADSPETRGRDRQISELDYLSSKGINMITLSLNNSDANFKVYNSLNPITFNETLLTQIDNYIRAANDRGIVVCLYLSEKENHRSWNDQDHASFITKVSQKFSKYCIIWSREEVSPDVTWVKKWYEIQQSADPLNPHFIHNNPGESPWTGLGETRAYLDGVAMQVKSNPIQDAASIVASCRSLSLASLKQEAYPTIGNNIDTSLQRQFFYAGGEPNAGFFKVIYDHSVPNAPAQEPFYTLLGSYPVTSSPTPVPPITFSTIKYVTKTGTLISDWSSVITDDDHTISVTTTATDLETTVLVTTPTDVKSVKFVLTGPLSHTQNENALPRALFGDTNGSLNGRKLTPGSYVLKITPYSSTNATGTAGVTKTINITIVSGTPTPVDVPGTGFKKTADGKIRFEFQDGSNKVVTPD